MLKLAVIADDFTGALDTGIKFAEAGARTKVMLRPDFSFSEIDESCTVLVVDAETRHLKPAEAYRIVFELVKRCGDYRVECIYKKTDSALRGCVGSELAAVADATGSRVEFIPALPKENRTTELGIQYINGVPVAESLFGRDPFEPVKYSSVPDIIHEGTDKKVISVPCGKIEGTDENCIIVYDAATDEDIRRTAVKLKEKGRLKVMAGCSGFAACLQELLEFPREVPKTPRLTRSLFVACGSVSSITKRQLKYAQDMGFHRISLDSRQKLKPDYFCSKEGKLFLAGLEKSCRENSPVILDGFAENGVEETGRYARELGMKKEDVRGCIARRIGEFILKWVDFGIDDTVAITGGDTVYAFLEQAACTDIEPVCEVIPGVVLFTVTAGKRKLQVVSKSGGFGDEMVFVDIAAKVAAYGGYENERKLS